MDDATDNRVPVRLAMSDGVHLHCERHGNTAARPVILLHGFGQTQYAWRGTAAVLAQHGYQALSYDARGHGYSQRADHYQLDDFITDLRQVAGQFDTEPLVVGASMGGLVGLLAAVEAPALPIAALVLVDITPRWESQGVDRILAFMRARPEGFDSLQEAADLIADYLPHRNRDASMAGLRQNLIKGQDGRYRWHWDPALLDAVKDNQQYQQRLIAAARKLTTPTLLVSGGLSDVVSAERVTEFLDWAPHAEHEHIADAAHMVAGDRNDCFNRVILDYLGRTSRGHQAWAQGLNSLTA